MRDIFYNGKVRSEKMVIRENIEKHMEELKAWLAETAEDKLEDMDGFFAERIDGYEEHMAVWEKAYQRFAEILPTECKKVLDLGCGTGLELDEIWKRNPDVAVTGVDLCQTMLDKLQEKHGDKQLACVCADYFQYDFGEEEWDAVISFESLHHFLPEKKKDLYQKIYRALKQGGSFVLGDYIACCAEEEELLQKVCFEKRRKERIHEEQFVHFDIPLTLEHELELMKAVGFEDITVADSIAGATLLVARK